MREIKFRFWHKEKKKWFGEGVPLYKICYDIDNSEKHTKFITEQFTGLQDKNGKDIYEGDVLHVVEDGDYGGEFYGEVEWLAEWAIYGVVCAKVKEIAKSKTNDRVKTIFTRGFLTRRYGS